MTVRNAAATVRNDAPDREEARVDARHLARSCRSAHRASVAIVSNSAQMPGRGATIPDSTPWAVLGGPVQAGGTTLRAAAHHVGWTLVDVGVVAW